MWTQVGLLFLLAWTGSPSAAWGESKEKVRLTDIKALTLYHGQLSTGRRSPGVPQLQCVGGSAGCSAFLPPVVQCYNRGSDGFDVQWECTAADMSYAYRFGKIEVVCEGYDYPDDPFILKGSCALEYTIELAESSRHTGQTYQPHSRESKGYNAYGTKGGGNSGLSTLLLVVGVCVLIYAIYWTCLAHPTTADEARSRTNDDFSGPRPPPPGFRSDYYSGTSGANTGSGFGFGDDSCHRPSRAAGTGAGGFWTGAATGGLLGYMFGRNNNSGSPTSTGTGSGFFGGGSQRYDSWGGSTSGTASTSSGSRTASGFGGTRRR